MLKTYYDPIFARPSWYRKVKRFVLMLGVFFGATIHSFGCSSAPAPLSIRMHNPKTDQSLTCSARDQRGDTDISMLAGAVETCAKNLEARGFVREK